MRYTPSATCCLWGIRTPIVGGVQLVARGQVPGERRVRRPQAAAVAVSVDDLASLEETLDIAGRPRLRGQVRDSLAELATGDAQTLTKDGLLASIRS